MESLEYSSDELEKQCKKLSLSNDEYIQTFWNEISASMADYMKLIYKKKAADEKYEALSQDYIMVYGDKPKPVITSYMYAKGGYDDEIMGDPANEP